MSHASWRRLAVGLAGASWLPVAVRSLIGDPRLAPHALLWCLLIGLTLLPLAWRKPVAARRACLAVGWLILACEILISVPWAFIPLPFYAIVLPAGVILLTAARRTAHWITTALAGLLPLVSLVFVLTAQLWAGR